MYQLKFTVDSALLRELGERLVGRPYVALAELIKNSYDADANHVTIEFDPHADRIAVTDDGHGMDPDEFTRYWMRIGSPHKTKQRASRNLGRPMTGSKGVGRLAVQYLARNLEISTVSENSLKSKLIVHIDWEQAVNAGDLTEATADCEGQEARNDFPKGTRIVLTGLKHSWDEEAVEGLAKEIWWLEPPFRNPIADSGDMRIAFLVDFVSKENYVRAFKDQMHAILDIWHARIVGKNDRGKVSMVLEFAGEEPGRQTYLIENSGLRDGSFEIRIYHLMYRQPKGITVGAARNYLDVYGGVHIYDAGFRLPYYGDKTSDWLAIERDHSHRLSASRLLPNEFQVPEMMMFLPTLSRIFGVVNVDTSTEPGLKIMITRDRLQESKAYNDLVDMIRWAMDFYASKEKLRQIGKDELATEIEKPKLRTVETTLEKYRGNIPAEVYRKLESDVLDAVRASESVAERIAKRVGLVGALATAGISSLAYEHEIRVQLAMAEEMVAKIERAESRTEDAGLREDLHAIHEGLSTWASRAKRANALFGYLADAENLETRSRYLVRNVIDEIKAQVEILGREIPILTDRIDRKILLPNASLAEWASIFQNVFINAFNALVDSDSKMIDVSTRQAGKLREILVQDTGVGVNLENSERLFEPFVREIRISPERKALGYGGTGLGLTIVRMVAHNVGVEASFTEPEQGFNTAFSLKWSEGK